MLYSYGPLAAPELLTCVGLFSSRRGPKLVHEAEFPSILHWINARHEKFVVCAVLRHRTRVQGLASARAGVFCQEPPVCLGDNAYPLSPKQVLSCK